MRGIRYKCSIDRYFNADLLLLISLRTWEPKKKKILPASSPPQFLNVSRSALNFKIELFATLLCIFDIKRICDDKAYKVSRFPVTTVRLSKTYFPNIIVKAAYVNPLSPILRRAITISCFSGEFCTRNP